VVSTNINDHKTIDGLAATDKNNHASAHNYDWSAALLMIATAWGRGHRE